MTQFHVYRDGSDGIYMVRMDEGDSLRIGSGKLGFGVISPNREYLVKSKTLWRLRDGLALRLDTLTAFAQRPEGTVGCGMLNHCFNARYPELAFSYDCDGYEGDREFTVSRVGLVDYSVGSSFILDDLTNLHRCSRPVFSPDGRHISVTSGGVLHIIRREVRP